MSCASIKGKMQISATYISHATPNHSYTHSGILFSLLHSLPQSLSHHAAKLAFEVFYFRNYKNHGKTFNDLFVGFNFKQSYSSVRDRHLDKETDGRRK